MNKIKNIIILIGNIFKKMPVMTLFVFLSPLFSGTITVYIYTAQVDLINIVANNLGAGPFTELMSILITPFTLFLGVNLIQALVNMLGSIFADKLSARLTWEFQSEIIDIANKVPYIKLSDKDFNNKLERAKTVAGEDLISIITGLVKVFNMSSAMFSLIILLLTNKLYLISVLVFMMIVSNLAIRLSTEIKVKKLNRELTYDGRVADYLSRTMNETSSIREMRMYGSSDYFLDQWGKNTRYQYKVRHGARKREIKMGIVVNFIQTTTILIVLLTLISKIQASSSITIGLLSVLFIGLIQCNSRIMDLLWPLCRLYMSSVKLADFNDVLSYRHSYRNTWNEVVTKEQPVPIIMKDVSFSYRQDSALILSDLSLTINKGEKIAIVGSNGIGKSTLIKLILGLYTPDSGEIIWNGNHEPSKNIAVVYQNFIKYELTLRENIGLGNVSKMDNDDVIIDIINKCGLRELYEKLGSLDRPVGFVLEGGRDISGGQWQRLAIARALLSDSDLLIFDEPTAAIDPQAEVSIYEMLMDMCGDKTAIFISHRLGWAKKSDRILVLDDKHIVEEGTHVQLIESQGLYYEMFSLQASWYDNVKTV